MRWKKTAAAPRHPPTAETPLAGLRRLWAPSLGRRLLGLLLPGMLAVLALGLWLTRHEAMLAANAAYDRSLAGALQALALNVSTSSGALAVELPYQMFEFFQLTASGAVYFRVATDDGQIEIGHPDLPALPPAQARHTDSPVFYDAEYFGEPVRVGAWWRPLQPPLGQARQVLIQVAESTRSRERFSQGFLTQAAWRDAALLLLMLGAAVLAATLALRPLHRLAAETRQRAPDDLRPLATHGLPVDVRPLVDAVNQQLQRSAALAEQRRRFIDDASHQLRTPLATLRTQLDYALREPDAQRREEALHALSAALAQAVRGTNQLLALARSDAGACHLGPLELGELVREVAITLLPEARQRQLDWGTVELPQPCWAQGDRGLLTQALANLAHNALVHSRSGAQVTLHAGADAQGWWLTVQDDGPGLPPAVAARLGQRFVRGPGSRGSGLGLAIAHAVMALHSGQLRVQPAGAAGGLCATLWWPRPAAAAAAVAAAASAAVAPDLPPPPVG